MPEPRIAAPCVTARLRSATRGGKDADAVNAIALRVGKTPRTIYRIMDTPDDGSFPLNTADELLLAAGGHLSIDCPDA